jgi:tripartite-type tricarboxylate transporter receptor subunit TctC
MGEKVITRVNYGFLAPQGTPPEIVGTIHQAAKKALEDHRDFVNERLDKLGAEVSYMGPRNIPSF